MTGQKTYGVTMMRNELDVVAGVVRHMCGEVDHVVVADNLSDDGTRQVLDSLVAEGLPLTVVDDHEVGYYQSSKMTRLARQAAEDGATWIVPFDADELWYSTAGRLADVLGDLGTQVVEAASHNHYATAVDPAGPDPFVTMQWRDRDANHLSKVAFRWHADAVIHQGNHGVTPPAGTNWSSARLRYESPARGDRLLLPAGVAENTVRIRHFPYRSADHFLAKIIQGADAYAAATGLPDTAGMHWRMYRRLLDEHGEDAVRDHYRQWFWRFAPWDQGMVHDPAPYRRWETRPTTALDTPDVPGVQ